MQTAGSTLPERIATASARPGGVTFVGTDPAAAVRVPWGELHLDARRMAVGLQRRGVGPGKRVALLGPTSRPLVTAIQATWLCGATAMVLPLPMRLGSLDEFVAQTRARIDTAEVSVVAIDNDLAAFVDPRPGDPPMVSLAELPSDGELIPAPPDARGSGRAAVHERVHRGPEGRHALPPPGPGQPRRRCRSGRGRPGR